MKITHMIMALAFVAALIIAGCIVTGTVVITAKLAPDEFGNPVNISNASYTDGETMVDLSEDGDYNDYKDNIRNIDNIGFYAEIENNSSQGVMFQLFLQADTSKHWSDAQEVIDSSDYLIFTGLAIPGNQKIVVSWDESLNYITGLNQIKDVLERGYFAVYPLARDISNPNNVTFNLTIDSMVVIVTLSGSP